VVPFLDTYRTICFAPEPVFCQILGTSGSCASPRQFGHARGEAPLGLREIDETVGIEDVPSTLFKVGIYQ
jgi:hypothetical protein